MASPSQLLYEKLHSACPQLCIGLYDAGLNLRCGDVGAPRRIAFQPGIQPAGEQACSCCLRVFEDWVLWFRAAGMDEAEVQRVCALAESIQKLLLQQQSLSSSVHGRQDKLSALLNRLLTLSTADDIAYTAMSALNMGFELTLPRVICLFKPQGGTPDDSSGEALIRSALSVIQSQGATQTQDLVGRLNGSQIVLCKYLTDYPQSAVKREIQPMLTSVCSTLFEMYHLSMQVVISEVCHSISDYSANYLEISRLQRCLELVRDDRLFQYSADNQLLLGLLQLPSEQLDHFLYEKIQLLEHSPPLIETIGVLLRHGMDINSTAEALFVHRNTVIFRINRIKRLLNIDPLHRDSDRALLMLLYLYSRLRPLMTSINTVSEP